MLSFVKTVLLMLLVCACASGATWSGVLRDDKGRPLGHKTVILHHNQQTVATAATDPDGKFTFPGLVEGTYSVTIGAAESRAAAHIDVPAGDRLELSLQLVTADHLIVQAEDGAAGAAQRLSSQKVSGLPLNKRDFSQLLLLASGAQTDTNGAANFTAQFAVNGQRGTAAVFAMDGIDTSDPELGGATFSNFNVDAIEEIRSDSGAIPADIGHGAASFTNVITKSGADQIHGALFEFVRNAAFDARNYFDRGPPDDPGRIPPFQRNEFGVTVGGPVVLPGLYNGRGRTYYFAQYQGFRQALSTTQVLSVPTAAERGGLDTTAFPGDTLFVPVNSQIASLLARYPFPNDPSGPYGARTYATSSKVITNTDQFSVRLDHRVSERNQLFLRFTLDNIDGPLTNPSQSAIDPSYAVDFRDRQRNAGLTYTRTASPRLVLQSTLGYERSAPIFRALNQTQPGMDFADGLYEPLNSTAGNVTGDWANLFQARQTISYTRGKHAFKTGFEVRANRDTAVFGLQPNGLYTFGGGTSYSPVAIRSASGGHNINVGDPLPDTLSSFLTASPFSYARSVSPPMFPQGQQLGLTGIRRESYNLFFQDTWKAADRLVITYGLRYEVNTPLREPTDRASGPEYIGSGAAAPQAILVNLQPTYHTDWKGLGPRAGIEWRIGKHTIWRASGAIVTLLPNIYQTNLITSTNPFEVTLFMSAGKGAPLNFQGVAGTFPLPPLYTANGQPLFATGRTTDVAPNTEWDLQRFENDLAAITPGHTVNAIAVNGVDTNFRNGYTGAYSTGFDQDLGDVKVTASYVATVGVGLPAIAIPNAYGGAEPSFAPYTKFDASGAITGGFGPEQIISNRSHSTYHSLQAGVQKTSPRLGLGFQANYTFSKSLDDASSIIGQFQGLTNGTRQSAPPQDPYFTRAEKGPSTFDTRHVVTGSLVQVLPFDHWLPSRRWIRAIAGGWNAFGVITLTSGSPFTVYSGIQQTGAGTGGGDRPDQIGTPDLSTNHSTRTDYFGLGTNNASYFFIPINVAGGTGPNQGLFGTLGRNTLRGPAFHNIDISMMKETALYGESTKLQFRAEVFNILNIVNLGLPANILNGPGFGIINHTAGASRQIQLSLKLLF
jgi:Carboxypeptidase regulatory-like domain/TonB dependent receptor